MLFLANGVHAITSEIKALTQIIITESLLCSDKKGPVQIKGRENKQIARTFTVMACMLHGAFPSV